MEESGKLATVVGLSRIIIILCNSIGDFSVYKGGNGHCFHA